jgi:nucleotide-binding universal stress UspA family protein
MKILVSLDLSDLADRAIEPAANIARAFGDELVLVTVSERRLRADLSELAAAEHDSVADLIDSFLRSRAARIEGLTIGVDLIAGEDASEALVDYASTHDVRMLVMATHGRSGIMRWSIGSVAERVVRHADVPVLVIPTR